MFPAPQMGIVCPKMRKIKVYGFEETSHISYVNKKSRHFKHRPLIFIAFYLTSESATPTLEWLFL